MTPELKKKRSDLLIADTAKYHRDYENKFLGKQEKVLFEEIVTVDQKEYLIGHNERYVKIAVPLLEAQEKGYRENEIHEVTVTINRESGS